MLRWVFALLFLFILLGHMTGCGEGNTINHPDSETGSVAVNIIWPDGDAIETPPKTKATPTIDCEEKQLYNIDIDIYDNDSGEKLIGKTFLCTAGEGTLENISVGENRTCVVSGKMANGNIIYQGEKDGITILPGPNDPIAISMIRLNNILPTVVISSPSAGIYTSGKSISFEGAGMDEEDGVLSDSSLQWSSSIDGDVGSGDSFSRNDLSIGEHTITLTVTDSDGAVRTVSVDIHVRVNDEDGDGINDTIDICPGTTAGEDVDNMGCSDSQKAEDSDLDSVSDYIDTCLDTPLGETVDSIGCSEAQKAVDDDGDGVPDYVDSCKNTPESETVDAQGCSDSQIDTDNDGVFNKLDQCSETPQGETVDSEGCSSSQIDSDGDGVFDNVDACPVTPENDNPDEKGCGDSQQPNSAPVAEAGVSESVHVGDTVTLNGSGSSDADGDTLHYNWQIVSPSDSSASLLNETTAYPEFTPNAIGSYVISLTVSDGLTTSSADTVTVTSVNTAPVAEAGVFESVHVGDAVTLNGSGSIDADGDSLYYNWQIVSPPDSNASLLNETTAYPEFTPNAIGRYEIRLTVKDGFTTSSDTVAIAAVNATPVAVVTVPSAVHVGNSVTLNGSGSIDADGDTLTYNWEVTDPSGNSVSFPNQSAISAIITPNAIGSYKISLTVYDGFENSKPRVVNITVFLSTVPDTGQTTCYDEAGAAMECPSEGEEYFGQDASYTINSPSYTKFDLNGNTLPDSAEIWAMVQDNVTGLIWEVKTNDEGIHSRENPYTWQDAQDVFIAQLNADNFGGHSDWRLPTVKELKTIVDYGDTYDLAVNTDYFVNTQSSNYWTSTTNDSLTDIAWLVHFYRGTDGFFPMDTPFSVRAVRGEFVSGNFTDNGDGTVTDNDTNLMWMQETPDSPMTWKEALAYCENLTLAQHSDWRLPTIKELTSIIDYGTDGPAIDRIYFPDTRSSQYWASTAGANDTGHAWTVHFQRGGGGSTTKSNPYYVRAVRGGQL